MNNMDTFEVAVKELLRKLNDVYHYSLIQTLGNFTEFACIMWINVEYKHHDF